MLRGVPCAGAGGGHPAAPPRPPAPGRGRGHHRGAPRLPASNLPLLLPLTIVTRFTQGVWRAGSAVCSMVHLQTCPFHGLPTVMMGVVGEACTDLLPQPCCGLCLQEPETDLRAASESESQELPEASPKQDSLPAASPSKGGPVTALFATPRHLGGGTVVAREWLGLQVSKRVVTGLPQSEYTLKRIQAMTRMPTTLKTSCPQRSSCPAQESVAAPSAPPSANTIQAERIWLDTVYRTGCLPGVVACRGCLPLCALLGAAVLLCVAEGFQPEVHGLP